MNYCSKPTQNNQPKKMVKSSLLLPGLVSTSVPTLYLPTQHGHASQSLGNWEFVSKTPDEWMGALDQGHTICTGDFEKSVEDGSYHHEKGLWKGTRLICTDGDEFGKDGQPKPFTDPDHLFELYPHLHHEAFAIGHSLRSLSKERPPPHCRFRIPFLLEHAITDPDLYADFLKGLNARYPIISAGRQPAQPVFGNAGKRRWVDGDGKVRVDKTHFKMEILGNVLSDNAVQEIIALGSRSPTESPKTNSSSSDIKAISELPEEYREAMAKMVEADQFPDEGGFAKRYLPCIFNDHEQDGWDSKNNRMGVSKHKGGFTFHCFKCDEKRTYKTQKRNFTLNPAPIPDPTQGWQEQQHALNKAFTLDADTILIKADTGVGKDYAKVSCIIQSDADAERFFEQVTRVELGEEKVSDFVARLEAQGIHKNVYLWRSVFYGSDPRTPFHIRKTQIGQGLMCVQPGKFDQLRKKGATPQAVLCPTCPVQTECQGSGYLSQVKRAQRADYTLSAQDNLFFDKSISGFAEKIIKSERDVVGIVDEVRAHELYSDNTLSKAELQQMIENWEGTPAERFGTDMLTALEMGTHPDFAQIKAIVSKLSETERRIIIDAFTQIRIVGRAAFDKDSQIHEDGLMLSAGAFYPESYPWISVAIATSLKALAELEGQGIPAVFRSSINANVLELSYQQAIKMGFFDISPLTDEIPDIDQFPKLHQNPHWTPLHQLEKLFDEYPRIEDTPVGYNGEVLTFALPPAPHHALDKLIMMSATAETEIIADKVFPGREVEIVESETAKWEAGNQVFQINTGRYPRASVLDPDDNLKDFGQKAWEAMVAEIKGTPEVKHAVITYKSLIEKLDLPKNVITAHYGATEGENEKFMDCTVVWILFDPRIPPHEVERRAKLIFGRDRIPLDYAYDKEAGVYKDERVQGIAESYAVGELIQAIGRARLVRRSGVQVVIMTGREIPGISGRAETQFFDLNDWTEAGNLDNLSATVQNRQDAADKAVKLLQSGASLRGTAKEANLPYRQVLHISEHFTDRAAAANRNSISKRCTISEKILTFLREGKERKTKEIVKAVGAKYNSVTDELKRLIDAGKIEKPFDVERKPRRGVYCLPEHSTDAITPLTSIVTPSVNYNDPQHYQFLPGSLPPSPSDTEFQRRVIDWTEGNRDFFEGLSPSDITHLMQAHPDLFEFEPFLPTGNVLDARVSDRGRLLRQENYAILRDPLRQGDFAEAIERSIFYDGDFSLSAVRLVFLLALRGDVGKRWIKAIQSAVDFEISRSHLFRSAPRADISLSRIHRYWGEAVDYRKGVVHPIVPFAKHWMGSD